MNEVIKGVKKGPVSKDGRQLVVFWIDSKASYEEVMKAFEKWVKENRPKEFPEPKCQHQFAIYAEAATEDDGPDMSTAYRKCRHCGLKVPLMTTTDFGLEKDHGRRDKEGNSQAD